MAPFFAAERFRRRRASLIGRGRGFLSAGISGGYGSQSSYLMQEIANLGCTTLVLTRAGSA